MEGSVSAEYAHNVFQKLNLIIIGINFIECKI